MRRLPCLRAEAAFGKAGRRVCATRYPADGSGSDGSGSGERGSATVLALAVIAVCLILAVSLAGLAGVQAARGRAQTAADLAALAAAEVWVNSTADPCGLAERVVEANGAALAGCSIQGMDVVVTARVPVAGPLAPLGLVAAASARAGP